MKPSSYLLGAVCALAAFTFNNAEAGPVVFAGREGAGAGKKVVIVTGDDEYRSEVGMPLMARILSEKHGFTTTVLFATNKETGVIEPEQKHNIPGLESLRDADLMIVFTRFRELEEAQMKEIVDYLGTGRPVMGLRTATHAFRYSATSGSPYGKYSFDYKGEDYFGGFGKQVLGETWVKHHGEHGVQSTRGVIAPGAEGHSILRGISGPDIDGPTDVYTIGLPLPEGAVPLVLGQVLMGMDSLDPAVTAAPDPSTGEVVDKNDPMMPVAWIRTGKEGDGVRGRVFTTTMGGALRGRADWESVGFRRLFVNGVYWAVGLEDKIPETSDVGLPEGENPFKAGVVPAEAFEKWMESASK